MGAMGPVLRKLDLLLASESRLRKTVKDGIGLLKQDLEEVCSALVDLSMLETPSLRGKCWMEEARELSYHIEDFVDDLMLIRTDAGAKIRSASSHRVGRLKIALLPAPPRRSTRVAKIAQLRDLLWQASERLERYQLDACCSSPKHMNLITQHRRAPALYGDAANLVGIEDSRTKLIEMLTGEAEQQLKVVSIVGPAGVGKTTLVIEIFRELRGQFELRAFVHASRKIDMRRLLGSILSQVQPHHQLPSVASTVQSLIDSIQEQLRDKRYLIVIDDLWEETAWDIVRGAFQRGNNCSRIVATTENMNVALKCCGYMADNILKMKPLGIQDAGYLFFNRVFGSEQQCPDELKEVSYGIIRKCFGLPLSLIHAAGLLASIDYSELWYHVHDCLCSILNRSHTAEEIQKKILNLSYNSLPRHLKTCLLYFSMYPEGYIMWKGHLVKQWIAEGFINAAGGKDREETAEGYFEELVNRGMVQPMKIVYNDEVLSCTVHHIIFDLINHNSKEEEFIAAIDYSQPITGLSTKAHRLSFRFSSAKYAKQPARITMSQLRSLGFFGFIKCMPPIVEFKHLRVLVLDFWGSHDGHMSLNLSRICILFQLRYLKISGDIMVELPAEMQGLHYLETLEIDARLSAVPLDIVHLPSLLHLGLRAATKLPDGIGHIKSLSTLLYFDLGCNSEDNIRSLGQLTNLRHLHLTCSAVLCSDHLKRKLIPLAFSLGKLGHLKSLTLTPDALRTAILFDISSGIFSPSIFLQRLEFLPPICFFSRLPTRFGELHKLRILKVVVKELQGNDINNIAGLPSLVVFSLYVWTALTGTVIFSTMAFPALKYFKFTCGVTSLAFQAGAMPSLRRLKLCFYAHRGENHSRVLDGIEHLVNLQEVSGQIGVLPGGDESDRRVVKMSLEDTIRKHPRCLRFNLQLVDFIEEKYYPPLVKLHRRQQDEHEIAEKDCAEDMNKQVDSRYGFVFSNSSPMDHFPETDFQAESRSTSNILPIRYNQRLDRRKAAKPIEHEYERMRWVPGMSASKGASWSPSSEAEQQPSPELWSSCFLDLTPSKGVHISESMGLKVDKLCHSVELSGPEDFVISPATWLGGAHERGDTRHVSDTDEDNEVEDGVVASQGELKELRIETFERFTGTSSLSMTSDDDASSRTSTTISLDMKLDRKIKSWMRGALLGSGSFGMVYEGISDEGAFFAVKEVSLLDQGSNAQQFILTLEKKIALLSQLEHENIVQYYGTEKGESALYIFIELVTRGSLSSLYQKYKLREVDVSTYTWEILNGLVYLHERNVVHRDIKCSNILVHANGSVKLADFGLADEMSNFNVVKKGIGSVYWMAPEVVNPKKTHGLPADIWSLGCTVLEMLTRQIPFPNVEWTKVLYMIGRREQPPIPKYLSKEAQDFIRRCMVAGVTVPGHIAVATRGTPHA
ncbi:unnamed protein product [Miscanthus lutarioriparius]|uniref:mitogen-activated protein kinase kinase kinase n=1 Tax=Miscanthus lutarioriparius TaxID=422564 RepID=A0A811QG44_9POAL|nr:unnamed protein product [Miscanthus lutarioriparius]